MNIAFFGDSLTEGLPGKAFFPLLQQRFPQFEFFNFGKGGDTVVSLVKRIKSLSFPLKFDLAFIWVGVNDVFVKVSPLYPFLKRLRGQLWAKNHQNFTTHYKQLLNVLMAKADWLFTVPPVFIGEDLENSWNKELEILNNIIEELSFYQEKCEFVDLRGLFIRELVGQEPTPYVPRRLSHLIKETLISRTSENEPGGSSGAGLHLTLDGVHLNDFGASLAAKAFADVIEEKKRILSPVD